jgi:hypothetical protein
MRLFNVNGKLVGKSVHKYRLDWDKKSRSKIQFKVKKFLKQYWKNHVCYEEFPVYGTRLKVDILNATKRIAVEVNGDQHDQFNKFFHNSSRTVFLQSITRDSIKADWLEKNKFTLIEIKEDEVDDLSLDFIQETFKIDIR